MSKETETTQNEQQQATAEAPKTTTATGTKTQASPEMQELVANGHVVLQAKTYDELMEKLEALKKEAKDYHLSTGPVGRNDNGKYTIRVDII